MATLTTGITATQTVIPVTGAAPATDTYWTVGSENVRFLGTSRGPQGRSYRRVYWSVDRGVGGSTAATHSGGASLTQYYPDASGGGGGGGATVTDGTTTVDPVTSLSFPSGSITDSGGGVASVSGFASATVVLTDAQIKTLADQGIEIVPAPGSGFAIIPVSATVLMSFAAGAYTPSSGSDYFTIGTGTDAAEEMNPLAIPNTASKRVTALGPAGRVFAAPGLVYGVTQDFASINDAALTISISGGNPTGGHAANTMTVTVLYQIVS